MNEQIHWEGHAHRVVIVDDELSPEPENEGGCPVLRINPFNRETVHIYGASSLSDDTEISPHVHGLQEYLDGLLKTEPTITAAIDAFSDWVVRRFEGDVKTFGPNQATDYVYVAFVTKPLRDFWFDNDPPTIDESPELYRADLDEIDAWLCHDTYRVKAQARVETRVTKEGTRVFDGAQFISSFDQTEWIDEEDDGTFYGIDQAVEAADEMRNAYLAKQDQTPTRPQKG